MRDDMQIMDLFDLRAAAGKKKAVVVPDHPAWRKPHPASWLLNLPGAMLVRLLECGMFVYQKKRRRKP